MAFPQIGLRAIFDMAGFNKGYSQYQRAMRDVTQLTQRTAQKITQSMAGVPGTIARTFDQLTDALKKGGGLQLDASQLKEANQAFVDLGHSARVNVDIFSELAGEGVNITDAMRASAGAISFNIDAWERMVNAGKSGQEAFNAVVSSIKRSRIEMAVTASVISASTLVFRTLVQAIREAITSYTDLAEVTRTISYQTGLAWQDASAFAIAMETQGISAASAERALTSFLSKASDLSREQLLNKEATSDFARALRTLDVDLQNEDKTFKSTAQLLSDVEQGFQNIGPGATAARVASDLFGYSGRNLLPILLSEEQSLSDLADQAQAVGAALSDLDESEFARYRQAVTSSKIATQGWNNQIARNTLPLLTRLRQAWADTISAYTVVNRETSVGAQVFREQAKDLTLLERIQLRATTDIRELGRAELERQAALERTGGALSNARDQELALADARDEALRKLDELKSKYAEKLAEIDADAKQRWDDILVNRARDAADRSLQNVWKLDDLQDALNEQLADIEADAAERWDNIFEKRMRDAIERGIRLGWQFEDLLRNMQQGRLDTIRDYNEREAEQRRDLQRRLEEAERDAQDKREKLERDHQRRLADIRFDYLDTVQEAARKNDAVAVARAIRERDRAVRDEQRRYQDEQADLSDSLAKKRQEIERDRKEREADQRDELARALQRIQENYDRQVAELVRQNQRERLIRELNYRWEEEDLIAAKEKQLQDARDANEKQLDELRKAQERENILRERQYEREEIDFVRAWQRRQSEARRQYEIERDELTVHLNWTGQQLEAAYQAWVQQASVAAQQAAVVIASAWASGLSGSLGAGREVSSSIPNISMAEGGVIHASSPTTVVMGDAGPETGIFLPGRGGTMNVNHNFGQLGVNFGGLPGGVDTAQIQSIVYQTMIQLAKNVQVKKWR